MTFEFFTPEATAFITKLLAMAVTIATVVVGFVLGAIRVIGSKNFAIKKAGPAIAMMEADREVTNKQIAELHSNMLETRHSFKELVEATRENAILNNQIAGNMNLIVNNLLAKGLK